MNFLGYFQAGLTVREYEALLSEDQVKLHGHHKRRAAITPEDVASIEASEARRVLVITEPWCGDSLAIFPVVAELFGRAGIEVRVAQRDLNPALIDQFLTNGGRAIPIAIVLNESNAPILRWGPRPAPAQEIVTSHKEDVAAGRIERAEVHKKVRAFYSSDVGKTIVAELVSGLADA